MLNVFRRERAIRQGAGTACPRPRLPFFTALIFVLFLCVSPLHAAVLKIQLPVETGVFKPAPGSDLANAHCLTCHSVEYVQMQPPKPLDFWTAEVKKMREKYGAQFPGEVSPELADYLAINYGTETNRPAPISAAASSLTTAPGAPLSAETLATKYGCLSCHKVNTKVVGPAFKDVAAKYRSDPAALDKISEQIHNGGAGKWGPAVMPPYHTLVTDAQADALARWIMSLNAAKP